MNIDQAIEALQIATQAETTKLMIIMVIIMVIASVVLARMFLPVIRALYEVLAHLKSVVDSNTQSNDKQTSEIIELKREFSSLAQKVDRQKEDIRLSLLPDLERLERLIKANNKRGLFGLF